MDQWSTVYSLQEEHQIEKGDLLTTIPILAKEWKLSFEFKANRVKTGFQQVLHMTTGGKGAGRGAKYGDRTPAIWIWTPKGFLISSSVGGRISYAKYFKSPSWWTRVLSRQWVKIEVGQKLVAFQMIYSISINGEKALSVKNSAPSEFKNVKVFSSSPWYNPVNGYIRNLVIENKGKGTCQKRFSGFCPLRGGGYPPCPLRKKSFFFHTDFPP